MIRCVFLSRKPDGTLAEKATLCKMARGRMARFLAEAGQADPDTLRAFDGIHWEYAPDLSEPNRPVYLEKPPRPGTRPAFEWYPPLRGAVPWRSPELWGYALVFMPRIIF